MTGRTVGKAARIATMTLSGLGGTLTDIQVEPMLDAPQGGFLRLHRTSETGAPSGIVYVNCARITHLERDRLDSISTHVWLADGCHVRVAESPDQIIEALAL